MTVHGKRAFRRNLAALTALVIGSMVGSANAAPTVAQVLQLKPRQAGVEIFTPSVEEQKKCTVELVRDDKGSGWMMKNAAGPIRRFFDHDGDKKIDVWSYYKDGVEIYREVDADLNGTADQYRWLNAGGQKWGVDRNEDGIIDSWKSISAEEVSQEIVMAIRLGDYRRLQALMITEAEMTALDLLPAERQSYQTSLSEARGKFDAVLKEIKDASKLTWLHLETSAPYCRPAASDGSRHDLIYHSRGAVLYGIGDDNDWMQTGVLVRVGEAWRIVGAPKAGHVSEHVSIGAGTGYKRNEKLEKLIDVLSKHDAAAPALDPTPGPKTTVVQHNLKRADLLEDIIAAVDPKEREAWIRQVADSLSTAAQNSPVDEKIALQRLQRLEQQIVGAMAGSELASYVAFRHLQAEYASKLINPKGDFTKIQQEWIEQLTKFVTVYPKTPDTVDALLQLGMVSEFLAKEIEAKKWYQQLVRDFDSHRLATKAKGALKRLDMTGKALELSGATLEGGTYDVSRDRGKVVVVYYWASWNHQTGEDFTKLAALMKSYQSKGLQVVTVNLDEQVSQAKAVLQRHSIPGEHLREDGGLESRLAVDYGIMVLPHVVLVDPQGKVVSRTLQTSMLEDEVNKLLKIPSKKK